MTEDDEYLGCAVSVLISWDFLLNGSEPHGRRTPCGEATDFRVHREAPASEMTF